MSLSQALNQFAQNLGRYPVTLASDDTAIADFVMWEAELMEDLNPDSVEEMSPIPRAEAHA